MIIDIFLNRTQNIMAENRLLKLAVIVFGATSIFSSAISFYAMNSQRTIIVPPVINTKLDVSGNKASDTYLREFSRYICGLAFSFTPATARSQFAELLTVFSPDTYPAAKKSFYQLADTIETTKATNVFSINKITVDSGKHVIEVVGAQRSFLEDRQTGTEAKTYLVDYRFDNGKFLLTGLSEKTNK